MSEDHLLPWVSVCPLEEIMADRGVCVLAGGKQVAVFRVSPNDELYAISNFDPFGKAFVLSRGIVGSKGEIPKVASPLYKQNFDLRTGECLDDPAVCIPTYPVRVNEGVVQVCVAVELSEI